MGLGWHGVDQKAFSRDMQVRFNNHIPLSLEDIGMAFYLWRRDSKYGPDWEEVAILEFGQSKVIGAGRGAHWADIYG
jgi:hypothetical protein